MLGATGHAIRTAIALVWTTIPVLVITTEKASIAAEPVFALDLAGYFSNEKAEENSQDEQQQVHVIGIGFGHYYYY